MSILRRIKNLWKISEFEVPKDKKDFDSLPVGTLVSPVVRKPQQMAQIIKRKPVDPIEELVNQQ